MNTITLKAGIKFKLESSTYTIQRRLPNLRVEALNENFNEIEIFSNAQLSDFLNRGLLKFEIKGKNTKADKEKVSTEHQFEDIENLKHKDQAIFRYEVLKPLLVIPQGQRNHILIEKRSVEVNSWATNLQIARENLNNCVYYKTVSKTTIYRWLKDFETSNNDFRSLVPGYHNCGARDKFRINPKVLELINESINDFYLNQQRVTIKDLMYEIIYRVEEYNRYSIEKLTSPAYSTLAQYVSKIPSYELISRRLGSRSAENSFAPIGDGISVSYPLERVEIDHTPLDVIIVGEGGIPIGRPYLVLAIDKLTRFPLGFSIGLSNGVGWPEVMQCIKHIITDKQYIKQMYPFIQNEWSAFGVPKTLIIDNGLEFKNNSMIDACYQLGTVLQFCPPKLPKWKGSIERFFGTSNSTLIHNLPGTTRSNPAKLGDDEDPTNDACINFSVFLALVHKWIIDVYAQDLNKGAGGIPSRLWNEAIQIHPVSWPANILETSILLGRIAYRRVTRRGIELDSLTYNSTDLNRLFIKFSDNNDGRNQSFKIKYDPINIGHVFVYDHLIDKRWIKVRCTNYDYADGLSEWEHKEVKAYAKKKYGIVDVIALCNSKRFIRDMIQNCIGYSPKHKARVNKINSSNNIETFIKNNTLNSREGDTNIENNFSASNSSDIGFLVDSSKVIMINKNQNIESPITHSSKNAIEIYSSKDKKQEVKIKATKKEPINSDDKINKKHFNIDFEEFSGFAIISDYKED